LTNCGGGVSRLRFRSAVIAIAKWRVTADLLLGTSGF